MPERHNTLALGELIRELVEVGIVSLHAPEGVELNTWLDQRGVDPETPVPVWNEDAQAWEV